MKILNFKFNKYNFYGVKDNKEAQELIIQLYTSGLPRVKISEILKARYGSGYCESQIDRYINSRDDSEELKAKNNEAIKKQTRPSSDLISNIKKAYVNGASINSISTENNIPHKRIAGILDSFDDLDNLSKRRKLNIRKSQGKILDENDEIIRLYSINTPLNQIETTQCSKSNFHSFISMQPKGAIYIQARKTCRNTVMLNYIIEQYANGASADAIASNCRIEKETVELLIKNLGLKRNNE